MKNLILLSAIAALFSFNACGQSKDVSGTVKSAFSQKFPDAKKIKWDKENNLEWEAEFILNGKEYSANFDLNGKWLETEYEISKTEIPATVESTLKTEFADYRVKESEISETLDGKTYEFEIKKDKTEMEIAIDPDGNVLKKEQAKEENESNEDKD